MNTLKLQVVLSQLVTVLFYESLEVFEVIKKSLKPPNSYFKAQWKEIRVMETVKEINNKQTR